VDPEVTELIKLTGGWDSTDSDSLPLAIAVKRRVTYQRTVAKAKRVRKPEADPRTFSYALPRTLHEYGRTLGRYNPNVIPVFRETLPLPTTAELLSAGLNPRMENWEKATVLRKALLARKERTLIDQKRRQTEAKNAKMQEAVDRARAKRQAQLLADPSAAPVRNPSSDESSCEDVDIITGWLGGDRDDIVMTVEVETSSRGHSPRNITVDEDPGSSLRPSTSRGRLFSNFGKNLLPLYFKKTLRSISRSC
jgi:hypothetical protein